MKAITPSSTVPEEGSLQGPISHARVSTCHPLLTLLPIDLYRELLKYLDIRELMNLDLALLNRHMREVYLSALSGTVHPHLVDNDLFSWLFHRNIYAKEIQLDFRLCSDTFHYIAHSKPALEILELYHVGISNLEIGACPKLKDLTLYLLDDDNLSFDVLKAFLQKNPQLERLSMMCAPQLSNDILHVLFEACPHLQHLHLPSCSWVGDETLDLISMKSPVTLSSLALDSSQLSPEKIREFILGSPLPSLRYLSLPYESPELELLTFQKIALPAMRQEIDQNAQLLGLQSLQEILDTAIETDVTLVINLLIQFLKKDYDQKFHAIAVSCLVECSDYPDVEFPTELLSSLFPFLSPDTPIQLHEDAMELVFYLIDINVGNDDSAHLCQILCHTCLIELFLSPLIENYMSYLAMIVSKGTVTQLTETITSLLSTPQSRLQASFPISLLLRDFSLTPNVLEAMTNSNLLKYLLDDLIEIANGVPGPNERALSFSPIRRAFQLDPQVEEIYLDAIGGYCQCSLRNPTAFVFGQAISYLPSLNPTHCQVLLHCFTKIVLSLPHLNTIIPSSLSVTLFSLPIGEMVVSCVMEITEHTLSLPDYTFLQHLVDSGLLQFLTLALKARISSIVFSTDSLLDLLHRVMRIDLRYVEIVASLGLSRALNRAVMKGFI